MLAAHHSPPVGGGCARRRCSRLLRCSANDLLSASRSADAAETVRPGTLCEVIARRRCQRGQERDGAPTRADSTEGSDMRAEERGAQTRAPCWCREGVASVLESEPF